jgi:hypothetical protein
MGPSIRRCALSIILLVVALASLPPRVHAERFYYAVEINGTVCGYSEIETSPIKEGGRDLILLKHRMFLMISALGSKFNSTVDLTYHIDPATGQFTYHDSNVKQGEIELGSKIYIEGNTARYVDTKGGEERTVELPADVILENTVLFPFLIRDFVTRQATEKTYRSLDVRELEVQNCTYTAAGTERIKLAGKRYDAIILDKLIQETGVKAKLWIDTASGRLIKTQLPNNRGSYLAKSSIVNKIKSANLDESIVTKVNVSIGDVKAVSYMKVRGVIEPTGLMASAEGLNVPGQSFTGTVEGNRIEGVFEVEHPRYDGSKAPPFPPRLSSPTLKQYLEPEPLIESRDPVLVGKATEITAGAKDSWEAAVRLSEWVAENIDYAIPGGTTARKTYDIKAGECGAHSILLAAFCRAVGIPTRVVWGCMYVPNYGGAFGQHAWNEIYMGDAGWIPVDATAAETDFLDSGHLRIGIFESLSTALNAKEMEVLDYRLAGVDTAAQTERYEPYTGSYKSGGNTTVKVIVKDGSLTVDIPQRIMLALNEPDDEGRWVSKISDRVYCTFDSDETGKATAMHIHELVQMPRKADPTEMPADVPEEYRCHVGTYRHVGANADFTVRFVNGTLVVDDPLEKATVSLRHPDEKGGWLDQYGKNTIYFDRDESGKVTAMRIDVRSSFQRIAE